MSANQKKEEILYLSFKNMKSLLKQPALSKSPVYRLVSGEFLVIKGTPPVRDLSNDIGTIKCYRIDITIVFSVIDRGSDIIIHRILVGSYIEKLGLLKRGDIIR